jgi:hypothetical protein
MLLMMLLLLLLLLLMMMMMMMLLMMMMIAFCLSPGNLENSRDALQVSRCIRKLFTAHMLAETA